MNIYSPTRGLGKFITATFYPSQSQKDHWEEENLIEMHHDEPLKVDLKNRTLCRYFKANLFSISPELSGDWREKPTEAGGVRYLYNPFGGCWRLDVKVSLRWGCMRSLRWWLCLLLPSLPSLPLSHPFIPPFLRYGDACGLPEGCFNMEILVSSPVNSPMQWGVLLKTSSLASLLFSSSVSSLLFTSFTPFLCL